MSAQVGEPYDISDDFNYQAFSVTNDLQNPKAEKVIGEMLFKTQALDQLESKLSSVISTSSYRMENNLIPTNQIAKNLMIDQDESELGQNFAVKFGKSTVNVDPQFNDVDVTAFYSPTLQNVIEKTGDSVVYYDSAIKFDFQASPNSITQSDVTVQFDNTVELNANIFKAVNSEYGRIDGTKGLSVFDLDNSNSFLYEGNLDRDSQGKLIFQTPFTNKVSDNGYDAPVIVSNPTEAFVGAIKLVQPDSSETYDITNNLENLSESNSSLRDENGAIITVSDITEETFVEIFGEDAKLDGLSFKLQGTNGGGYSMDTSDVVTCDAGNIDGNMTYMNTLKQFGNDVAHKVEVKNGSTSISGNGASNYSFVNSTANESLNGSEYNTNGEISVDSSNRYSSSGDLNATLDVKYDYEENGMSSLYYTTKDITWDAKCLLGSTVDSNVASWSNVVDNINDTILLSNGGPNANIELISCSKNIDQDKTMLVLLDTFKDFSDESGLLEGSATGPNSLLPVNDTFINLTLNNANLNISPFSSKNDTRVKLTAKTINYLVENDRVSRVGSSWLTCDDLYLKSGKITANIMKDDVYKYIASSSNFNVNVNYSTQTSASSSDTLTRQMTIDYSSLDVSLPSGSVVLTPGAGLQYFTDSACSITLNPVAMAIPQLASNYEVVQSDYVVSGITCEVRKFVSTVQYFVKSPFLLGPYQNMYAKLGVSETTTRYALWNISKSRYLPDSYLLSSTEYKPSRSFTSSNVTEGGNALGTSQIGTEIKTSFVFKPDALKGFLTNLQTANSNETTWNDVANSNSIADLCFDQITNISVGTNGTLNLSVDTPMTITLAQYYYINMASNTDSGLSTIVKGAIYSISQLENTEWDNLDTTTTMSSLPANGTSMTLSVTVQRGIQDSNGQSSITYKIYEGSTVIAELSSPTNIIAGLKIFKNVTPKFKLVESGVQSSTTYTYLPSSNVISLVNGVNMTSNYSVSGGQTKLFTLLYDKISATLYQGSTTNYQSTNVDIDTPIQDSNASKARQVNIARYRGNRSATIVRSPSQMRFVVTKGIDTYTQPYQDYYVGKVYTVNSDFDLGSLGIAFTGVKSMFDSDKSRVVTVSFGSYTVYDTSVSPTIDITVSNNNHLIYQLSGYKFFASKVISYSNESWEITAGVPHLKVYKINELDAAILGDLSSKNWGTTADETFTQGELTSGVTIKGTSIFIKRTVTLPTQHTVYINCPPPQFGVTASKYSGVSIVPVDSTSLTNVTRYMDYVVDKLTNYNPFAGITEINDLKITFNSVNKSFMLSKLTNNRTANILIETNKVNITVHAMDNTGVVLDLPAPFTVYNNIMRTFNGTGVDSDTNLAYNATNNSTTCLVSSLKIKTRFTPTSITSDNLDFNLTVGNMHWFNLGSYVIKMQPGNSLYTSVYGHSYSYQTDDGTMKVRIVRYDTDVGIDFDPLGSGSMFKSYSPYATSKWVAEILVQNPSLTATPYSFSNIINAVNMPSNLTWSQDNNFVARQLSFAFVCLSTVGQSLLRKLFSVNQDYTSKFLLCNHPDLFRMIGADGAVRYRVNAHGRVCCNTVNCYKTVYSPIQSGDGNLVLSQVFNYDVTSQGAL